jgi:RimJ/RimL family protein N-acetyltransferase
MQSVFETTEIRIRPYHEDDVAGLYDRSAHSLPEMMPFLPWAHEAYSLEDSQRWVDWAMQNWQFQSQYDFVIESTADNKFLGGVGILELNPLQHTGKLGYWVGTQYTGKGIATQASQLAIAFAKTRLKLRSLYIDVQTKNIASILVAKKLGAKCLRQEKYYEHDAKEAERYVYWLPFLHI